MSNWKLADNPFDWLHKKLIADPVDRQLDQSQKPEEYRTPTNPRMVQLPYSDSWDGQTEMRYSWHPDHGLSVWPANTGFHMHWMQEHGIPDTSEGDESYAGGVITPDKIHEYHAGDPEIYSQGINAVRRWISVQGYPVPPVSPQMNRRAGVEEFHEDARRAIEDHEALARDIIKTLPPEEWPKWVRNYVQDQIWGKPEPIDWTPYPHEDAMDQAGDLTLPKDWTSKVAASLSAPATYTPQDPLDLQGKQPIFQNMNTQWWTLPPDEGKQAVVNAFRATMLSPRMNLKGNAILYQSLMHVDPHESDPDVFENIIRAMKTQWDAQGQTGIGVDPQDVLPLDQILPGKMQPGIWTNIRRLAALGPYADQLYEAAMKDVQQYGGTGQYFRNAILEMNIPGVKAKVASFAWLALAPMSSELGTIDVHMMRHLNQDVESPKNMDHYTQLEDQLRQERDQLYPGTPLTQYQWGVWDKRRTPGFHQDHSPLRPVDPTPYTDVYWAAPERQPRPTQTPNVDPNQLSLSKWVKVPKRWSFVRIGGYSIQGQIVSAAPQLQTDGVAVRPDVQSREEIESILGGLSTHEDDAQKQRGEIPEWALNRGGKIADMRQGPSGEFTYAPGVVLVSEWVDVDDNWILYHDRCVGIVAGKGGATSHGVVVARERNIPIIVNVPQWNAIRPGDTLRIDSASGVIHGNGGSTEQFDKAQEAEEPVEAFVWSGNNGLHQAITPGSGGAIALHRPMIRQLKQNGLFDPADFAMGVIYANGRVQMQGQVSDQEAMQKWLNTIMPTTSIENMN